MPPGGDATRSATSRWTMSVKRSGRGSSSSIWWSTGLVTWYGRLATRSQGADTRPSMGVSRMSPSTRRRARIARESLGQVGMQPFVDLDRGHPGARAQQCRGQDADARADLQDRPVGTRAGGLDDRLQHRAIDQVVLAQPLACAQPVTTEIALDLLRTQVDRIQLRERVRTSVGCVSRSRRLGQPEPVTRTPARSAAQPASRTDAPRGRARHAPPPRTVESRQRRSSRRCRCTGPDGARRAGCPGLERPSRCAPAAHCWRRPRHP